MVRQNSDARYNRRHSIPGKLKIEAARIVTEHAERMDGVSGMVRRPYIEAYEIKCPEGQWKVADVYRWEFSMWIPGITWSVSFGCWETLTYFVPLAKRNGIDVNFHIGTCGAAEICARTNEQGPRTSPWSTERD